MRNLIIVLSTIALVIILQFEFVLVALGVIWFFIRRRFKSNKPIPIDRDVQQNSARLIDQLFETGRLLDGWFTHYPDMTERQVEDSRVFMKNHIDDIHHLKSISLNELRKNHQLRSSGSDYKTLREMREKEFENI